MLPLPETIKSRSRGKWMSTHSTRLPCAIMQPCMDTKISKNIGEPGHRSQCLSHAKRALYHLSYAPCSECCRNQRLVQNIQKLNIIQCFVYIRVIHKSRYACLAEFWPPPLVTSWWHSCWSLLSPFFHKKFKRLYLLLKSLSILYNSNCNISNYIFK